MNLVHLALTTMAVIGLSACEGTARVSSPGLVGRVVDGQTGAPVAGAIVYALWEAPLVASGLAVDSPGAVCYHAETAVSDATGNYEIRAWQDHLQFRVRAPTLTIRAYKSGYQWTGGGSGSEVVMISPATNPEQEVRRAIVLCQHGGESQKNLYVLFKSLYYDTRSLPASDEQQQLARMLRLTAARVWVGFDPVTPPGFDAKVAEFLKDNLQ